ncbi:hypothetical protein MJO29_013334 [Puccinia striiformis f. sp. tritici]|nr:hypothetical protein MJO29_013334 [Puccinia striiformis f. sp. tritici]
MSGPRRLGTNAMAGNLEGPSNEKAHLIYILDKRKVLPSSASLDIIWAYISLFGFNHNSYTGAEVNPSYSTNILQHFEIWRSKNEQAILIEFESHNQLFTKERFHHEVSGMLDLLWILNSKLVKKTGLRTQNKTFLEKHQHLQMQFYDLLTLIDDSDWNKSFSQLPKHHNRKSIQEKLIKALGCDDNQEIYHQKGIENKINTTKKQLMLTEAAVEVMISYYWGRSPSKFLQLFQTQGLFVANLANLESRNHDFRNNPRSLIYEAVGEELNVLPWKNYFIPNAYQNKVIRNEFHWKMTKAAHFKIEKIQNTLHHFREAALQAPIPSQALFPKE